MKSVLRATAILSSGSIASILLGLVSAKVLASLLGPSGFGFIGLLQSLIALTGLFAGMGVTAGLARFGAKALADGNDAHIASLRSGAWLVMGYMGGFAVLILVVFRAHISRFMLGGTEDSDSVALIGLALLFTLGANIQIGTLTAYHRVGALATMNVANTLLSSITTIALVWLWGKQGIVPAVVAGAGISLAVSSYFLRREVGPAPVRPARREVVEAARSLLRFGAPFAASILVGQGVQLALPVLVLHTLGTESVGFYRAATRVSGTYLAFLITAMVQDYYPRVSAAADQPTKLVALVNVQHRLIMLLSVPIILGTMAMAPYVIPLLYTPEFQPAVALLEWQLIGDIFKFSSWTMGFIVLARCGSSTYFFTELSAGLTTLCTSWLFIRWFGLPGLGLSFLATYVVYYLVVWSVVRREIRLVWTAENKRIMLGALTAALVVQLLSFMSWQGFRTIAALSFALLAGVRALYAFRRDVVATKRMVQPLAEDSPG